MHSTAQPRHSPSTRAAILLLALLPFAAPAAEPIPEPWHPEDGDICLRPGDAPQTDAQRHLALLFDRMRPVLDGFPSLAEAWKSTAPPLCIEDRGYLETTSPRIVLRDDMTPDAQAVILVHDLRHLEQWTGGTCLHDGLAMAAATADAFDRWYAQPERTGAYYRAVCSDDQDRLDATKRLPGTGALPGDYLTDVCRLPSGGGYACAEPATLPR